jgi:hypothetical protein
MTSYHATQALPLEFAVDREMVAGVLSGRVDRLVQELLLGGHDPLEGSILVSPVRTAKGYDVHFTWTSLDE